MAKTLTKIKLQKTTLIWLGLALSLGIFVYFTEVENPTKLAKIKDKQRNIFDFKEEDIQKLTIEIEGKTLKFARVDRKQSKWQMKEPEDLPANDGVVAFLLNLLVEEKSERSFIVPANNLDRYNLQPSRATIKLILKNKKKHKLILGKSDFQNKLIYARINPSDPSEENVKIVLVSKNFQYAVLERKLEDWKK